MNKYNWLKTLVQTTFAAVAIGGLGVTLHSAEPAAGAPPANSVSGSTNAVALPAPVPVVTQITGAELYSMHCNRCHPERYPTERTAAQWKTIMLHMQVRANIPGAQARQILKYLQENSGR
jgi:cytochrome c5